MYINMHIYIHIYMYISFSAEQTLLNAKEVPRHVPADRRRGWRRPGPSCNSMAHGNIYTLLKRLSFMCYQSTVFGCRCFHHDASISIRITYTHMSIILIW